MCTAYCCRCADMDGFSWISFLLQPTQQNWGPAYVRATHEGQRSAAKINKLRRSATQIHTSNAGGETTPGRRLKVRHWWAECRHWFWCQAVNPEGAWSCCRGYSHVFFTLHLTTLLFLPVWSGNKHQSWLYWFNHCQVVTQAPVWLWWELRAPLRLLHTSICGVFLIHLAPWHPMIANHGTINFRLVVFSLFNWRANKTDTGWQCRLCSPLSISRFCISFSWSVSCSCTRWWCRALILPPTETAGDLHVAKLLHPTVFAELRDQAEGETVRLREMIKSNTKSIMELRSFLRQ